MYKRNAGKRNLNLPVNGFDIFNRPRTLLWLMYAYVFYLDDNKQNRTRQTTDFQDGVEAMCLRWCFVIKCGKICLLFDIIVYASRA